jgi:hypothetical protein
MSAIHVLFSSLLVPLLALVPLACAPESPGDDPTDPSPPDPGDHDCASLPDTLPAETTIEGARAYKGLAFDNDGDIVGNDEASLIKSSYSGDWRVFVPGVGTVEGMVYLPDGYLIVTTSWDDGHMRRIAPSGGITVLVHGLNAYSVVLGPDGLLYAAGWDGAFRVDPDTGEVDTLMETGHSAPWSARTLAFSAQLDRLYIGTVDDDGRIFYWDLDEDLEPIGEPRVFVSGVGGWRSDALYLPVPEAGNVVKEVVVGVPAAVYPQPGERSGR